MIPKGVKLFEETKDVFKVRVSQKLSINQMQQQVIKGQAPKSVTRVESGKGLYERDHVHFKDGSALNKDGTWKHGGKKLSNEEKKWLEKTKDWRSPNE